MAQMIRDTSDIPLYRRRHYARYESNRRARKTLAPLFKMIALLIVVFGIVIGACSLVSTYCGESTGTMWDWSWMNEYNGGN